MNCDDIRHKLSLLIDGQLNESERQETEKHLAECPDCREYNQKLVRLNEMADNLFLSRDEQYWEKQKNTVLEKIEKAESEKITDIAPGRNRNLVYKFIAVAASIALVAFVSIYESKDIEPTRSLFSDEEYQAASVPSRIDSIREKATEEAGFTSPDESVSRERLVDEDKSQMADVGKKSGAPQKSAVEKALPTKAPEVVPSPIDKKKTEPTGEGIPEDKSMKKVSPGDLALPEKAEDIGFEIMPQSINAPGEQKQPGEIVTQSFHKRGVDSDMEMEEEALDFGVSSTIRPGMPIDSEQPDLSYDFWRARLDSLEESHREILSPHYMESRAKSGDAISPDSLDAVILEMAESCYRVGVHTADSQERELMIGNLKRLAYVGSPEVVEKVQNYIALLLASE